MQPWWAVVPCLHGRLQVRARGGKVVFLPTEDDWDARSSMIDLQGGNMTVCPACHEGVNRSQVLYRVLADVVHDFDLSSSVTVDLPHGAVRSLARMHAGWV